MINDVRALREPGAIEAVVAASGAAVCLMHMQGEPRTMQADPHYDDVVGGGARTSWSRARRHARSAGIARDRIVIDPGFGFGKTVAHNLALLRVTRRVHGHRLSGSGGDFAQVDTGEHHRT